MENYETSIEELSFSFAIGVVKYSERLEENKKYVIAKQIIRSGTSIGANISEAQKAESKSDFIHKLKLSDKEAAETAYWLKLCDKLENYPYVNSLMIEILSIQKILNKIIATTKRNMR